MAWQSPREILVQQLRVALPSIRAKTANALAWGCWSVFGTYHGSPPPTIEQAYEWLRTVSDDDLLAIRNFGEVSLREVRSAQATDAFGLAGPCNWVGEGVPD